MCWNDRKINFPTFIFRVIVKNHRKLGWWCHKNNRTRKIKNGKNLKFDILKQKIQRPNNTSKTHKLKNPIRRTIENHPYCSYTHPHKTSFWWSEWLKNSLFSPPFELNSRALRSANPSEYYIGYKWEMWKTFDVGSNFLTLTKRKTALKDKCHVSNASYHMPRNQIH